TLPFVLLLLDYWPLGRLRGWHRGLVLEKVPLLVLSVASCAVTLGIQAKVIHYTANYLGEVPFTFRVMNVLVAYVQYLGLFVWPSTLAVLYPHPGFTLAPEYAVGAGLLLVAITALTLWGARRYPYLPVGWFWYLGTLVPVIGLIQVGYQAWADRYTYVPLIGILIMLTWFV